VSNLCVNFNFKFFSSDFRLLSFGTFDSYCSKFFIFKENERTQFFKKKLVANGSIANISVHQMRVRMSASHMLCAT